MLVRAPLRDADGTSSLKPGHRYRLSYCVKLKDVKPTKIKGGANANIWAGENLWFPNIPFSGTQDWTYQSFEFKAGADAISKGPSRITLRLYNAEGEAWFDHVRIEALD